MDFQSLLYDPIYSVLSVDAKIVMDGMERATVSALDKTTGIDVGDEVHGQTILPAIVVRARDLFANGIRFSDLAERGNLVVVAGQWWNIVTYRLRPSPNGERDGEVYLLLSRISTLDLLNDAALDPIIRDEAVLNLSIDIFWNIIASGALIDDAQLDAVMDISWNMSAAFIDDAVLDAVYVDDLLPVVLRDESIFIASLSIGLSASFFDETSLFAGIFLNPFVASISDVAGLSASLDVILNVASAFTDQSTLAATITTDMWLSASIVDDQGLSATLAITGSTNTGLSRISWVDADFAATKLVAVSTDGNTLPGLNSDAVTTDGITWTSHNMQTQSSNGFKRVRYASSLGLLVANSDGSVLPQWSADEGSTWTIGTGTVNQRQWGLAWSPSLGIFVSVGLSSSVYYSADGKVWSTGNQPAALGSNRVLAIAWSPALNLFVCAGDGVWTSPDPRSNGWTRRTTALDAEVFTDVTWSPTLGLFALTTASGHLMTSPDGITWTQRTMPTATTYLRVKWIASKSKFIAFGYTGSGTPVIATSSDGITWTDNASIDTALHAGGDLTTCAIGEIASLNRAVLLGGNKTAVYF